jgi:hypothetical protein
MPPNSLLPSTVPGDSLVDCHEADSDSADIRESLPSLPPTELDLPPTISEARPTENHLDFGVELRLEPVSDIQTSAPSSEHDLTITFAPSRSAKPVHEGKDLGADRYTLTSLHGEGGIGQVWLASDHHLSREVPSNGCNPTSPRTGHRGPDFSGKRA